MNHWQRLEKPRRISADDAWMGRKKCNLCSLHTKAKRICSCIGRGSVNSQVMFVGEAPGEAEERRGIPFIGKAGQMLADMLQEAEWDAGYTVTNAVCCRPPGNATPTVEQWRTCSQYYLKRSIRKQAPLLIVCFGLTALKAVTGDSKKTVKDSRRRVFKIKVTLRNRGGAKRDTLRKKEIPVVCTYHPAYILRDPTRRHIVVEDLRQFMRLLSGKVLVEDPKTRTYIRQLEGEDLPWNVSGGHALAIDLETTGTQPFAPDGKIRVVGLSQAPMHAVGFPLGDDMNARRLKQVLDNAETIKVGHNLKFDLLWLKRAGFEVRGDVFDTMVAFHLMDENYPDKRLRHLANLFTTMGEFDPEKKDVSNEASIKRLLKEVCIDADATYRLYRLFSHRLRQENLLPVFGLMMDTLRTLVDVEYAGVAVDQQALDLELQYLQHKLKRVRKFFTREYGRDFNPQSSLQVRNLIYGEFGIRPGRRTGKKRDPSTDELSLISALRRTDDPLQQKTLRAILKYREFGKLSGTYIEPLRDEHIGYDGHVHPNYNLAQVTTGRLSCNKPNFQNVPPSMRKVFVSRFGDDGYIVQVDAEQMELRILAHYSGEAKLKQAFEDGDDIHAQTAAEIFRKKLGQVTKEERYMAKTVNFAIVYGATGSRIAEETGLPLAEAEALVSRYHARLPGVRNWVNATKRSCIREGVVTSLFGRKRRLPMPDDPESREAAALLRQAVNFPIQSSASDINLVCMNEIHKTISTGMESKIIGTVHDSILFDCPKKEVDEVMMTVDEVFDRPPTEKYGFTLDVPLKVKIEFGHNWGELKELPR